MSKETPWSLNSIARCARISLSVQVCFHTKLRLRSKRLSSLSIQCSRTKKLSQESQFAELSLALFMLRILANYSDTTFSFDDFAFLANGLYRWSYLHRKNPPFTSCVLLILPATGFWSGRGLENKASLASDLFRTSRIKSGFRTFSCPAPHKKARKNRRKIPAEIIRIVV